MPLYPYRCTQCGHRFEKIQRFNAKPERVCPKCGGALERLLTAPGLKFKGSGWYVTDYASKGSSSAEATSGESKSETKAKSKSPGKKSNAAASSSGSTSTPSTTRNTNTN